MSHSVAYKRSVVNGPQSHPCDKYITCGLHHRPYILWSSTHKPLCRRRYGLRHEAHDLAAVIGSALSALSTVVTARLSWCGRVVPVTPIITSDIRTYIKHNNMSAIQYKRPGRWVPAKGGYMPKNPVSGGEGAEGPIYVGMAHHESGNILGMVVPGEGCCYIPWGGEAVAKDEYFILASPSKVELTWVPHSDGNVPPGAFQGGFTEDGEPLFIGRISVDGIVSCGKVHPSHGCCYVPYGGAEHAHKHYEVLCVKSIPCRL